jgi:DNA-directed RNA polymerase II subunit RPB1
MGIVQDAHCGIRKFTLHDTFLDWNQVTEYLLWVPEWDASVPLPTTISPKPLWTGKQLLSLCIPRGINIFRYPDPKSSNLVSDDGVMIGNGEIMFGVAEKTAGNTRGGLIHVVFREAAVHGSAGGGESLALP